MPLFLGQLVSDRYRIDSLIKQDSRSALYRVQDLRLNMTVVFIENLDPTPAAKSYFSHEAGLLTQLSHPNLPRVFDHFTLPGQGQYLVMDLVEGEDLQTRLNQNGVLGQTNVLDWLVQVSEALVYLHNRPDIGQLPTIELADIVVKADGRVTLLGFEVLKRYTPGRNGQTGEPRPTLIPGYSAPEQYGRQEQMNERSQVYALGAVMYHLLTGQIPPESIQLATGSARLIVPSQLNPEVTPAVQQFILKAMAPDASMRFQSLAEFQRQLMALKYDPSRSPDASITSTATSPGIRLSPLVLGGLGLALGFILLIGIYFSFVGGIPAESSTPVAATTPDTSANALPVASLAAPTVSVSGLTSSPEPLMIEAIDGADFAVEVVQDPVTGVAMVRVPAGPFVMGGSSAGADGQPAHEVSLEAYYIDQVEVTNAQYAACVSASACQPPADISSYTRDFYYGNPEFEQYPVVQLSWEQANTFCAWRGGRLPTEAEWEKAARGTDQRTYPWGEGLDCSLANWATNSGACLGDTTAVGSYRIASSPYGAYDMAGNVWEWVADWYAPDYYAVSPAVNPPGPVVGEFKVLRGGSWVSNEPNMHAAFRNSLEPSSTSSNIGFRCVR